MQMRAHARLPTVVLVVIGHFLSLSSLFEQVSPLFSLFHTFLITCVPRSFHTSPTTVSYHQCPLDTPNETRVRMYSHLTPVALNEALSPPSPQKTSRSKSVPAANLLLAQ